MVHESMLSEIAGTCFFESTDLEGASLSLNSNIANQLYKTDLSLLRPDTFTQITQVNAQSVTELKQDHILRRFKVCQGSDNKLTGVQLQLGVSPSDTTQEEFEDLFVLYSHGLSRNSEVSCEYLVLEDATDFVRYLTFQYTERGGVDGIRLQSFR